MSPLKHNATPAAAPAGQYAYAAFISYSHSADGKFAPALQSGLQQFARPWNRLRAIRVFRDQTGLAVTPALWSSIVSALDSSEYFLLLASPQAARSHWVDQEVRHWLSQPRADRLLIVVTEGNMVWDVAARGPDQSRTDVLPPSLCHATEEPLWLDLRWAKASEHLSLQNPSWREAVADLSSTLRGIPKDQLIGEDVRQHARATRFRRAAITGLALLAVALGAAAVIALQQRDFAREQARIALARQLAAQAELIRTQQPERLPLALLMASEAVRSHAESIETQQTLQSILSLFPSAVATFNHATPAAFAALSADAQVVATAAAKGGGALWRVADQTRLATLAGADRIVLFSPDGKRIAGCCERVAVWTSAGGPGLSLAPKDLAGLPQAIAFSPDSRHLAIGVEGSTPGVAVFDLDSNLLVFRHRSALSGNATAIAFAPNGDLAVALRDRVETFSGATGQPLRTWEPNTGGIQKVAFSPDGRYLASGSSSVVTVFDLEKGTQAARLDVRGDGPGSVQQLGFSASGGYLATVGDLNTGTIWRVGQWREIVAVRHGELQTIYSVSFDADATEAVTCGSDGYCIGWSLKTGQKSRQFAHQHAYTGGDETKRQIVSGAFGARTSLFVTAGADGTARVWRLAPAGELERLRCEGDVVVRTFAPQGRTWSTQAGGTLGLVPKGCGVAQPADVRLGSIVASPTGKFAAVATPIDVARVWETDTGKVTAQLAHADPVDWEAVERRVRAKMSERASITHIERLKGGSVSAVAVAPSGRRLTTFRAADQKLRIWDATTAQVLYSESRDETPLIEFLSDTVVLRVDTPGTLSVMHLPTGSPAWAAQLRSITALTLSEDRRLVSAADHANSGSTVRVWEVGSGKQIFEQKVDARIESMEFDRASRYLVAALGDQPVVPSGLPLGVGLKLWDVSSGREALSVPEIEKVVAFDFSQDSTRFAHVSRNGGLTVHDLSSGEARKTVAANPGPVAFSASGRWIAMGSRSIRILETSSLRPVSQLEFGLDARHIEFRSEDRILAVNGFEPGDARGITQLRHWLPADILAEACRLIPAAAADSQWRQLFPETPLPTPCAQ